MEWVKTNMRTILDGNLSKGECGSNPFGLQKKLMIHYDRIHDYLKNDDCRPICSEVNLTSRCNMSCVWCISENMREDVDLDYSVFKEFVVSYKDIGGKSIIFSGGGEPTLHKNFLDAIKFTNESGIDVGLMTNGLYNDRLNVGMSENCKWIRYSIDFASHVLYKKYKNVSKSGCEKILSNVKSAYKIRNSKIWVNLNVGSYHSLDEIKSVIDQYHDFVDGIQIRPVLSRAFAGEEIHIDTDFWNNIYNAFYNIDKVRISMDKVFDLSNKKYFDFIVCDGHMIIPVLNCNGDVCVCMYQTNNRDFVFGNVYKNSLKEIWESKRRRDVIEFVRSYNYPKDCQVCCKLSETNKFLQSEKDRYNNAPYDMNFI